MKSWKIGAIAGLIAGIFSIFVAIFTIKIGLPYFWYPPSTIPIDKIVAVEIIINVIWGIALSILYFRFYDLIPGRGIIKGLIYGMILGFIFSIRCATFDLAYSRISTPSWIIYTIPSIVYGLVLEFCYEYLQRPSDRKKLRPSKFDIAIAIQVGAIAGLIGGIVIDIAHVMFWNPLQEEFPKTIDFEFLISQLGTHSLINMLWGAFFGILFTMFYIRIPGKKILKGIVFAIIIFFITSFRFAIYGLLYELPPVFVAWGNAIFLFLAYGIILGLLYRKPVK